jgi:hypothetical protein
VSADGHAGPVDVAEGLRVGGGDDPVDVDPGAIGEARELVGEGDVDVAIGGLGQLGQLGRLRGAHRPDLGVQETAVQRHAARLAAGAEAAHQLGVGGQVAEHAPAVDALGTEDAEELVLGAQSAALGERGGDARARRAHGHGRLDRHGGAGPQPGADVAEDGVEGPPIGLRVGIDEQRGHGDHELGAGGHRLARVGGRGQPSVGDDLCEHLGKALLAGEWRLGPVDEVHDRPVDVAADNGVARACDLCGDGQSDLAQRDDDGPHWAASSATVWPVRALASAASATITVSRPSVSVTTGAFASPASMSQKVSSSTSSGSRRASA